MQKASPEVVNLYPPIVVLGKHFLGDYSSSEAYCDEVHRALNREKIEFVPDVTVGIYYDNPDEIPERDLRSFHGVIPRSTNFSTSLAVELLTGLYLKLSLDWPTTKTISRGYQAMVDFLQNHDLRLRSNIGYQFITTSTDRLTLEFYIEIEPINQ